MMPEQDLNTSFFSVSAAFSIIVKARRKRFSMKDAAGLAVNLYLNF